MERSQRKYAKKVAGFVKLAIPQTRLILFRAS